MPEEIILTEDNMEDVAKYVGRRLTGKVAAIPTDTSYGLAASAYDNFGVKKVFNIKMREQSKMLSVFVSSVDVIQSICVIDEIAEKFIEILPERLTLILKVKEPRRFAPGIVSPENKIGVRLPPYRFPPLLAREIGEPITATSANISCEPPIYNPRLLKEKLTNIDIIVNAGELPPIPTSTVIDVTKFPPVILRSGPVSPQEIRRRLKIDVLVQ
ncbi:MAG: L-threonylcarbamoyladenylate synthase [Thermofilaceae archaeon]